MQKWEYLFVVAFSGRGEIDNSRPESVNGESFRKWANLSDGEEVPLLVEFSNQLGEQGWELVSAPPTPSQATSLSTFKRPKE